jgi:hypothetical protein
MTRDFFDPAWEDTNIVLVDESLLRKAEMLIESCEHCNEQADFPFDVILDRLTGSDPSITDYMMERPARCPRCLQKVTEKTSVEPGGYSASPY